MYFLQGDDLPPFWERKRTETGRVFYVNYVEGSTQWVSEQHSTTRCTCTHVHCSCGHHISTTCTHHTHKWRTLIYLPLKTLHLFVLASLSHNISHCEHNSTCACKRAKNVCINNMMLAFINGVFLSTHRDTYTNNHNNLMNALKCKPSAQYTITHVRDIE